MVTKVEPTGLEGSMNVAFACNRCELRTVNFCGSALVEGSKRTVVGLALAWPSLLLDMAMPSFLEHLDSALESAVFPRILTMK